MQKEEGGAPARELSAEQFTLAKEQEMRARGAEIITAEASFQVGMVEHSAAWDNLAASSDSAILSRPLSVAVIPKCWCLLQAQAGSSSGDAPYRPKVATWGIFPRPANISRQYGGGRTFKPGEVPPCPCCLFWQLLQPMLHHARACLPG